ncbi:type I polyketide synthase [Solimonas terrae]|uniref:Acyltransferase domain-containing protein n=1 Tax=Solimonas terrae TaxID=1396819 RepID=A0A6M2BTI2_9GAMM|nr:type I polyketide synthase [Solimonas terrae]NGY05277.1 acyltransferase domain-containing protein [Solimonas terrae]
MSQQPLDIAIIGVAGIYPGAGNARQYWQNILDKVDAVREADPEWVGPYFEENATDDDRIYTTRGGFLGEHARVNPQLYGVMPTVAAGADPDHLLSLKCAHDALDDAGYLHKPFDRERAGVVVGRGTYGNRGMAGTMSRTLFLDQAMDLIRGLRPDFSAQDVRRLQTMLKDQLPPFMGEHIGVLTPNVIAGLIANRLNLMGPSYIVDAACATTMIALESAVRELNSGRCDLMLVGGSHAHTPPQIFMQFCRINALSRDRIRPFQKGSEGTLLGEGVGMLVLKRRADAERDGDRIYAVVRGIGTASDGRAKGLLAPRLEGEILAVRRAYQSSGIDPMSIDLIEAHGTGTSVGDKTEIESLRAVFGERGHDQQIGITAVKSMIGHCMPASGGASLIKMALALHHKVLPPMLCDEVDPTLQLETSPFYLNTETRPWIHGRKHPRRAGVNAFGFGGINSHVILEEYRGPKVTQVQVLHAPSHSELLVLAAESREELLLRARTAMAHLQSASLAEVAKACSAYARGPHRLALICSGGDDLHKKLEHAIEKIERVDAKPFKTRGGIHYGVGDPPGKLCFLFPGEGSQYPDMLSELCVQFPQVRDWFDFIERNAVRRGSDSRAPMLFPPPTVLGENGRKALESRLFEMDVAAESVFAASLGLHALFEDLGIKADAMLGHSTGENTVLTAAGVGRVRHREETADAAQQFHRIYRELEAAGQIAEGSLLTIGGLTPALRSELLANLGPMHLAMDNCPNQLVLFGPHEQAAKLHERLRSEGAICQELPFGRAYHTALFKPLADAFRAYFQTLDFGPGTTIVYSASTCAPFPDDAPGIRELAARQWEHPVRFTETVQRLYEDGYRVFLEVGPSGNLSSFVGDILRGKDDVLAVSSNSRRKSGLAHLHQTLAQLFAAGVDFEPARLFAHRSIAEIDLLTTPKAAAKPLPQLKLINPVWKLPEEFRRPLPSTTSAAKAVNPEAARPSASATPPPAAPAAKAPSVSDPRLDMLNAHFALMQDFLDSQARVLGLAAGVPGGVMMPSATAGQHPLSVAPAAAPATAPVAGTDIDPLFPMLGTITEQAPGRMVMERRYDLDRDLFLRDHTLGNAPSAQDPSLTGLAVIPFTFSMEMIAQAAMRLAGRSDRVVVAIEHSRGSRWLSLDDGGVTLRIVAEATPDNADEIACRVFLLGDGTPAGGMLVFEGQVRLAAAYPPAPAVQPLGAGLQAPHIHLPGQLYAHGMFHGPRLQGCTRIDGHNGDGMVAELTTLPTHDYFAGIATPRLQFDAALLDAAGQLAGFWLRERNTGVPNCFPFRVRSLTLYAPPPAAGLRLRCDGAIVMRGDKQLDARWDISNGTGQLLMRAEGWEDRVFTAADRFFAFRLDPARARLSTPALEGQLPAELCVRKLEPLPEGMLDEGGTIWKRMFAHMVLSRAERRQFYALPAQGPRREEWLMGRLAAKDAARDWYRLNAGVELAPADVEIDTDARGKPFLRCPVVPQLTPPSVSIAHSRRWAYAVASASSVDLGLDYQRPDHVNTEDLITGGFAPSEHVWLQTTHGVDRSRIALALWAAKEAAAKAAGSGLLGRPRDWQVIAAQLDRRSSSPTVARVRHGEHDYDIALHFENSGAVLALCVTTATHPPIQNPPSLA